MTPSRSNVNLMISTCLEHIQGPIIQIFRLIFTVIVLSELIAICLYYIFMLLVPQCERALQIVCPIHSYQPFSCIGKGQEKTFWADYETCKSILNFH